jgi:predicted Fe-Mo cluster-binding NifX family protein
MAVIHGCAESPTDYTYRQEIWQMRIVVSSQADNLDGPTSLVFGRCPTFVFVEPETMEFEAMPNPAASQGGGAGIQAAQFVVNQGAGAVLTGNLGPNAFDVLEAAEVPGYLVPEGSVRDAVEDYRAGRLQPMSVPNVGAHAGMRARGPGAGMGRQNRPAETAQAKAKTPQQEELADLRQTLKSLRQQLAETMTRIEELERQS